MSQEEDSSSNSSPMMFKIEEKNFESLSDLKSPQRDMVSPSIDSFALESGSKVIPGFLFFVQFFFTYSFFFPPSSPPIYPSCPPFSSSYSYIFLPLVLLSPPLVPPPPPLSPPSTYHHLFLDLESAYMNQKKKNNLLEIEEENPPPPPILPQKEESPLIPLKLNLELTEPLPETLDTHALMERLSPTNKREIGKTPRSKSIIGNSPLRFPLSI